MHVSVNVQCPALSVQRWVSSVDIAGNASATGMVFWCWRPVSSSSTCTSQCLPFYGDFSPFLPENQALFLFSKKWKRDVDTEKTTSLEDQIWPSSFASHSSASSVSLDNQNSALCHCLRTEILVQARNKPFFSRFPTEKKGEQKILKPEFKSKRTGIFGERAQKKQWLFATSDTPTGLACKRILGGIIFSFSFCSWTTDPRPNRCTVAYLSAGKTYFCVPRARLDDR